MQFDISNMTIEELYEKIDIQARKNDLKSKDKKTLKSTIRTLSSAYYYIQREDALEALTQYYQQQMHNLDDIEFFFDAVGNQCNYALYKMILKDLSQNKNFYRKKHLVNKVLNQLSFIHDELSDDDKDELVNIIENSVWGKKLKDKFIDKIREDNEDEAFEYLFG